MSGMTTVAGVIGMRRVIVGLVILVPSLAAVQEPNTAPRQQYEALIKEYESASGNWSEIYNEVPRRDELVKRYQPWPAWSFAPRFFKMAEDHPKDPVAVEALLWVVRLGQSVNEIDQSRLDERELVKRLADKPVALLSVNTAADRKPLRKSIKEGEITWRCWFDGGVEGPIAKVWNVTWFPTIYVLDATGVIGFKDLRGPSLDDAVMTLMKESWHLEFEDGQAAAKARGKDLLIDFGGSDWCGPCKWLKDRVLSKPEFIERASVAFVLVDIDLPYRSPIAADRKRRYEELQKRYGIASVPTVVLATADGRPYARTTYRDAFQTPGEILGLSRAAARARPAAPRSPEPGGAEERPSAGRGAGFRTIGG